MNESYIPRIDQIAEGLYDRLKEIALKIHANPELGYEEYLACGELSKLLSDYGFDLDPGYLGIPTAFKASFDSGKPGPKIAMLCEYDALPEIGHGCGHNLIGIVGAGSGIVIKEFAAELGGSIDVIGTPAEETAGAKVTMADRGAFDGYDVVMMAHPDNHGSDSYDSNAIIVRKFEFFGKTAHAAGSPEKGINALDAMISFFSSVGLLRQQTEDGQRIHGVILKGGEAPNIIPDYTMALFYIRSHKMKDAQVLAERVYNCAKGAALQTGCRLAITPDEIDFKDIVTNKTLSDLVADNTELFPGEKLLRRYGEIEKGSSDMGDVSYKAPAVHLYFGICPPGSPDVPGHTREFAAYAATDYAIKSALRFVKGFAKTAVDLMTSPDLVASIRQEYEQKFKE